MASVYWEQSAEPPKSAVKFWKNQREIERGKQEKYMLCVWVDMKVLNTHTSFCRMVSKTADWIRWACSCKPMCWSIMMALSNKAVGFALSCPAMSGAVPWTFNKQPQSFHALVITNPLSYLHTLQHPPHTYRFKESDSIFPYVPTGGKPKSTHKACTQVTQNIPIEVGHYKDIKLRWILDQLEEEEREREGGSVFVKFCFWAYAWSQKIWIFK